MIHCTTQLNRLDRPARVSRLLAVDHSPRRGRSFCAVSMMTKRTCTKCGETKPLAAFYKLTRAIDGRESRCKKCTKQYAQAYRKKNREVIRAKARARYRADPALRKRLLEYHKQYRQSGTDARSRITQASRRWVKSNLGKIRASRLARYALKTGRIIQTPCELCGEAKSYMHHHDYSQPYDVKHLCREDHAFVHRVLRRVRKVAAEEGLQLSAN